MWGAFPIPHSQGLEVSSEGYGESTPPRAAPMTHSEGLGCIRRWAWGENSAADPPYHLAPSFFAPKAAMCKAVWRHLSCLVIVFFFFPFFFFVKCFLLFLLLSFFLFTPTFLSGPQVGWRHEGYTALGMAGEDRRGPSLFPTNEALGRIRNARSCHTRTIPHGVSLSPHGLSMAGGTRLHSPPRGYVMPLPPNTRCHYPRTVLPWLRRLRHTCR